MTGIGTAIDYPCMYTYLLNIFICMYLSVFTQENCIFFLTGTVAWDFWVCDFSGSLKSTSGPDNFLKKFKQYLPKIFWGFLYCCSIHMDFFHRKSFHFAHWFSSKFYIYSVYEIPIQTASRLEWIFTLKILEPYIYLKGQSHPIRVI